MDLQKDQRYKKTLKRLSNTTTTWRSTEDSCITVIKKPFFQFATNCLFCGCAVDLFQRFLLISRNGSISEEDVFSLNYIHILRHCLTDHLFSGNF